MNQDRDNGEAVAGELENLGPRWTANDVLPNEEVPVGNSTRSYAYGHNMWVKMFNPRQQLAHGHCVEAFRERVDGEEEAELLDECRKAAWCYVALAIDKLLNYNSTMSIWHSRSEIVANTFNTHDFGFKWSYAEMAITCQGLGLEWTINEVRDCLSDLLEMTGQDETPTKLINLQDPKQTPNPSRVINGEAQFIPDLEDGSIDCIVFDPPYHDNVCYAELSDFFYVWLKRTAGHVFPRGFTLHLSEKDLEAIASPVRFKNTGTKAASAHKQATADYEAKMAEIFAECRRVIKPDGIMTVMFTHKSTTAWDALTVALISAGFSITRTWPVKTEAESSMHIKDKAAARTTILLVCRPRQNNPTPEPWHRVEDLIAKAVQDDIGDNLSQAELKPIDLYLSAFGPALKVISEHWGTERETANMDRLESPFTVTPTDALQVARTEVSRHRSQAISKNWAGSPMDEATKFYILANDASGGATMEFDEANLLARAIGTSLDKQDTSHQWYRGVQERQGLPAEREGPDGGRPRRREPNAGNHARPGPHRRGPHGAPEHHGRAAVVGPEALRPPGGRVQVHTGSPDPDHQARARRPPGTAEPVASPLRRRSASASSRSGNTAVTQCPNGAGPKKDEERTIDHA